ncbi:MAG TPA: Fic family protein [Acidobacteriaceae bacterium]
MVLKNLLGIEDALILEAAEIEMTTLRSEQPLPQGRFDANHYRGIHRHLFQDVYQWAGEYRTVRIAKGDSIFCYPENIPSQMQRLFGSIDGGIRFLNRAPEEFAAELARFLAELNAIHPFREGNGRAQLSCVD